MKATTMLPHCITKMLETGADRAETVESKRAVYLINASASLTCILIITIGMTIVSITGSIPMLVGVITETLCFVGVIMLNKYGRHNEAAGSTLLIHCCYALFFGALMGPAMPLELITVFLLTMLIGGCYLMYRVQKMRIYAMVLILIMFSVTLTNNYTHFIEPMPIRAEFFNWIKGACILGMVVLMAFVTSEIISLNDRHKQQAAVKLDVLTQEKKEMADATKEKIKHLHEAAHDLRTPISAVISFTDMISWEEVNNPKVAGTLRQISRAGTVAREVLNNTLYLAKFSEGERDDSRLALMNLNTCIDDSLLMADYFANKKKVTIKINNEAELPEHIVTDEVFVKRILYNVLTNAIKYSPDGSEVNFSIKATDEKMLFTVSNISAAPTSELSKRMGRYKSERNTFESFGLGLSVIANLLKKLHGGFRIDTDDVNVHVYITIPFALPDSGDAGATIESEPPLISKESKGLLLGRRVAIIEDNEFSIHILTRWCQKQEASFNIYRDGPEGLDSLQKGELPDVLIVDHNMPKITGDRILSDLRYKNGFERMKVVVSSAEIDPSIQEGYSGIPGVAFLSKPLDFGILNAIVAQSA